MVFLSNITFLFIYAFTTAITTALAASFNTTFPTQQYQCTDFNVNISTPRGSQLSPTFPLTLLVIPVSSSTPQVINIPETSWNATSNSLFFSTKLPYPSGTIFVAAIHDSQGGRASADVSQLLTMQGTSDASCFVDDNIDDDVNGQNTPNQNQQLFTVTPSPPVQCGPQILSWKFPDLNQRVEDAVTSSVDVTGFLPGGSAFSLKQANDASFGGRNASWPVDIPEGQDYVFLVEYKDSSGIMWRNSSSLQTVTPGTSACIRATSPTLTILANGVTQVGGVVRTSAPNLLNSNVQINGALLIFIAIACIIGTISGIVLFIVVPTVYFCRKRRARATRAAFGLTKDLEKGDDKEPKFVSIIPFQSKPSPFRSRIVPFETKAVPFPDKPLTPITKRWFTLPRRNNSTSRPKTPRSAPLPPRKSSLSERKATTPKSASLFRRAFGDSRPSDVDRTAVDFLDDNSYYSRSTLYAPAAALYDPDNMEPYGSKEKATLNAPYASYTAPTSRTINLATRPSPTASSFAPSPLSARIRGKEPMPPLPPNPGSLRRPSRGRTRPEDNTRNNRDRERDRSRDERSREKERERERAAAARKTGSVDSFGNEGPLPLSMTETDIPPRPRLRLVTEPSVGVAVTTDISPIPPQQNRRETGIVGGNATQPLRLARSGTGNSRNDDERGARLRYVDLDRVTEDAANVAAAVMEQRQRIDNMIRRV